MSYELKHYPIRRFSSGRIGGLVLFVEFISMELLSARIIAVRARVRSGRAGSWNRFGGYAEVTLRDARFRGRRGLGTRWSERLCRQGPGRLSRNFGEE